MTNAPKYIAIAGNIGSGKSSLTQFLETNYQIRPFYEPNAQNPYLADFYTDMKAWSFHSQLFFLIAKFRMHQKIATIDERIVLDRTIYEDAEIFAKALFESRRMNKRDFDMYWNLYQTLCSTLRKPDLLIYLRCPIRTLEKRIALRGRKIEQNIPRAYLKKLESLYVNWLENYKLSEVVIIDTEKLDYVSDMVHRIDVMKKIEAFLKPTVHLFPTSL